MEAVQGGTGMTQLCDANFRSCRILSSNHSIARDLAFVIRQFCSLSCPAYFPKHIFDLVENLTSLAGLTIIFIGILSKKGLRLRSQIDQPCITLFAKLLSNHPKTLQKDLKLGVNIMIRFMISDEGGCPQYH